MNNLHSLRMIRLKYIIVLLFVFSLGKSQDAQFSQFYSAPLYMAPSFAGSTGGGRIISNFRDQWPQIKSTYITYAVSADYYFDKYNSGVGLLMLRDQAGEGGLVNTTNVGLLYSYNFDINQTWKVRPGLTAYYYVRGVDVSALRFGDQILRSTGSYSGGSSVELTSLSTFEPIQHFDFTSSVLAYSDKYWVGFTLDHIMYFSNILSAQGDYLPFRYSAYAGGKYIMPSKTRRLKEESITVALNFMSQSKLFYLDLGVYYTNEPLIVGLWYRGMPVFPGSKNVGALTTSLGYRYKAIQIGYSFDFTMTRLITQTGGAHEISVSYIFNKRKKRRVKHKMVPCPAL
jgi:type IX secretion system PorP/SprF family membrane protein